MTTRAEIAVIGSGPGGAITAGILAEAGRDVMLLEEGPHLPLESCEPFTLGEMQQKYRNRGMTVALGRVPIVYVEGQCVGGGSEINSGLYHRTPSDVLAEWRQQFQVEALTDEDLRPHFEAPTSPPRSIASITGRFWKICGPTSKPASATCQSRAWRNRRRAPRSDFSKAHRIWDGIVSRCRDGFATPKSNR